MGWQVLDAATGAFVKPGPRMGAPRARVAGATTVSSDGSATVLVAEGSDGHEASEALTIVS
jgi:hypothetical protein